MLSFYLAYQDNDISTGEWNLVKIQRDEWWRVLIASE